MRIEVIDLQINNLTSVMTAIGKVKSDKDFFVSIDSSASSMNPDLIILPGLGHFASGMRILRENNLDKLLVTECARGTKIVGICLGMQLLCRESSEGPGIPGLGLVNGKVLELAPGDPIPNIGWGEVESIQVAHDFPSIDSERDFYFVHSYCVELENQSEIFTQTKFSGQNFVSSYKSNNVIGFQFHPEKSGKVGEDLLAEVIEWAR